LPLVVIDFLFLLLAKLCGFIIGLIIAIEILRNRWLIEGFKSLMKRFDLEASNFQAISETLSKNGRGNLLISGILME
jgi:hypothetical protein